MLAEECSMQWLARHITQHVLSWAIKNFDVFLLNLISDVEVFDVEMPSALGGRILSILL